MKQEIIQSKPDNLCTILTIVCPLPEIRKQTKEAFFSELGKPSLFATGTSAKIVDIHTHASKGKLEVEEPAWAPLQDNYMLTSSRLKDWDKMPDNNASDVIGKTSEDSSDED